MMLRSSAKYVGRGCITLAALTHLFEGEDDIEFLAVMDAYENLPAAEQEAYRYAYNEMLRDPAYRKRATERALAAEKERAT